jgi:hypothetical protein
VRAMQDCQVSWSSLFLPEGVPGLQRGVPCSTTGQKLVVAMKRCSWRDAFDPAYLLAEGIWNLVWVW